MMRAIDPIKGPAFLLHDLDHLLSRHGNMLQLIYCIVKISKLQFGRAILQS
jgi:hypothetical protein